ncbi:MAG: HAMP domain-containing protein [Deltaproteobacteria bacterium]|nr:HAMP domain-containing protein [Deltaproteobacteria bacterium]
MAGKLNINLGIRAQLAAGIVIITLAGIGLVGLFSVRALEQSAVYWKVYEARSVVRFVRAAFRESRGRDPQSALNYAAAAMKESGIGAFRITDSAGAPILKAGTMPENLRTGETVPFSADFTVRRSGGGLFRGPGDFIHISAPLVEDGSRRGAIEFVMPLSGIKEDMAGVRRFLLFIALLDSVVVIAFSAYFLSKSVISPIRGLEEAAKRISGGALGRRAVVQDENEIGSLARSFNTMAERIEDEIKTLERVNKDLLTAQEELLRSSTLAAVGSLAAGIAHEIGNPLGAVRGYIDLLRKGGLSKEDERDVIGSTSVEAARIDSIVREFLEISMPPKRPVEPVDVNGVMDEAIASLQAHGDLGSAGVEIRTALKGGVSRVLIDAGKLRQVLMNLFVNAAHSMADKEGVREITVETLEEKRPLQGAPRRRKDDARISEWPAETGERRFVSIRITDTGSGMSEETARNIFDPFFTTKDVGKGTGLGLFVSQSIIKAYGGEITFTTKEGEGSSFTVSLPGF